MDFVQGGDFFTLLRKFKRLPEEWVNNNNNKNNDDTSIINITTTTTKYIHNKKDIYSIQTITIIKH